MRLAFLGLSLAGIAAAAPSAAPGLKIVTRETLPTVVVETTEYIQSDRMRVESRVGHRTAQIMRCDLRKSIFLNEEAGTYTTSPLWTPPGKRLSSLTSDSTVETRSPNLLIETTTVQTAQRKDAFGYAARRVITTRRQIPLDATAGERSESQTDGWYIDLETRPSCEREEMGVHSVLLARKASASGSVEFPIVTFKDIGEPERGYPIDVKTMSREHAFVTHKVVVQLSRQTLDPALFAIPPGFRPAEGRLAALAGQLGRVWETITALVADFVRSR